MTRISPIIEIHYHSGGLKAELIGLQNQNRPEWLPRYQLVGPKDIQLDNNEYVIELSRFEKDKKLITWIGVWSKGVDLVLGDRGANYIGVGVWFIDTLPSESYQIVSALIKICDLLVREKSPTDNVKNHCNTFLNSPKYLQLWIKDIKELPSLDKGLIFQTDEWLQCIYVKSKEHDLQEAIIAISDSILINCVCAEDDFVNKSQILYLILNSSNKVEGNKVIKHLARPANAFNIWLDYMSILNESKSGLSNKIDNLTAENEDKTTKIKASEEKLYQLEQINQSLTEEKNKKTGEELLVDLKTTVASLIEIVERQKNSLHSQIKPNISNNNGLYNNPNAEALAQIKNLCIQIKDQKNNTLNSISRTNVSVDSSSINRPKNNQLQKRESSFSRFSYWIAYSIGAVIGIVVLTLIFYKIWLLFPTDEANVKAAIQLQTVPQPEPKNSLIVNINELSLLNSKLDNISSKIAEIEKKVQQSNTEKPNEISSGVVKPKRSNQKK